MKTSELKRIVEENGYVLKKVEKFIYIRETWLDLEAMKLDLQDQSIILGEGVKSVTGTIKNIMVALIKYSLTPPSEREDEKYRIMIDSAGFKDVEYLTLIANRKTYYFSVFSENDELYQRIFTQQEIDNFPAEIKGAIECGFLRKVEVA